MNEPLYLFCAQVEAIDETQNVLISLDVFEDELSWVLQSNAKLFVGNNECPFVVKSIEGTPLVDDASDSCHNKKLQRIQFATFLPSTIDFIGRHEIQFLLSDPIEGDSFVKFVNRTNLEKRYIFDIPDLHAAVFLAPLKNHLCLFVEAEGSYLQKLSDETGKRFQNVAGANSFAFVHPKLFVDEERRETVLMARLEFSTTWNVALNEMRILVGDFSYVPEIDSKYPVDKRKYEHRCKISIRIPFDDEYKMSIHNAVRAEFLIDDIDRISSGIKYSKHLSKYAAARTAFHRIEDQGLVSFLRQNVGKKTTFSVRHANVTDNPMANFKLFAAWILSKFLFWVKPVLVFEKNGIHYEESGRIVFETMVSKGFENVFFVLNESVIQSLKGVDKRYLEKIIPQHSFKHYLYFFCSNTFLGSEALAHCLELRCSNLMVQRKLKSKRNKYVFLQHGVMYMISLDSPQRSSFRRKGMKGESYIVVSSKAEADHFIQYADFEESDLIVCGLPKFDSSYMNPGADKILIMPTWRIWEFNQVRQDFSSTKYFKMVERIYEAIPDNLKEKVILANHPLFNLSTFSVGGSFDGQYDGVLSDVKRVEDGQSYDELLRDVRLIITDYSSISYDAYYRGANAIFYWEEKDYCMEQYGEGTHLMIDEETAFGPVAYSAEDLPEMVSSLYCDAQPTEYLARFRRIVEHHDGRNTERLLSFLEQKSFFTR